MTRGVFRERGRYSRKPIAWTSRQRGPVRSWISASRSPGPPSDVRLVHGCRGWIAGKPCRASCPVGCLSPLSPMYVGLRRTVSHPAAYRSAGPASSRSSLPIRPVAWADRCKASPHGPTAARAYFTNGSPRRRPSPFRLRALTGGLSDPVHPLVRCEVPRVENPILPPEESHRKAYASRVQPGSPGSTDAVADRFVPTSPVDSCGRPVTRLSTRDCRARLGVHAPCPGFPQYAPFRVLQESLWI